MVYRPYKPPPDAIPIGTVIDSLLRKCRPGTGDAFNQVWELWDDVVGHAIADQARPSAFNGGILIIQVTNSVWLQQLQFLRQEILTKLNDRCGSLVVRELKFKIGGF
jgi:predicted nucleic acid-binding Zn ribbon protein